MLVIVDVNLVQLATRNPFYGDDVILNTEVFEGVVRRGGIGTSMKLGERRVGSGAPDGGTMGMWVVSDSWHDSSWEEVVECGVGEV